MADGAPVALNRIERILAYMIAACAGLSIVSIIAVLIAGSSGADLSQGAWPIVVILPFPGLLIAFLLIVAFLVVNIVRRRRTAGDGGR